MVRKEKLRTDGVQWLANLVKLALFGAAVVLALALGTGQAYAQDDEDHSRDNQGTSQATGQMSGFIPTNYEYVVATGNNQTLLVRRSAQLYDLANDSVSLSPAQLIYVETNVVKDMGAEDLIFPEDKLDVMSALIAKYAQSGQELSAEALDAWQVYADNADFEIEDISPLNVTVNNGQVLEDGQDQNEDLTFTPDEETQGSEETENSDWAIWLITAGVVAILAYGMLRVREQK